MDEAGRKHGMPIPEYRILYLAAFVTIVTVTVLEYIDLGPGARFTKIALLLAGYLAVFVAIAVIARRFRDSLIIAALLIVPSFIATAVMIIGFNPGFGVVLFSVVCTTAGLFLPAFAGFAWVIFATTVNYVVLRMQQVYHWEYYLFTAGTGVFSFYAFAVLFRKELDAREESRRLLDELSAAQDRLRDLAVLEERQRLAREMHDAVGHRLTAAAVLLEAGARLVRTDPDRATHLVETSRTQVKEGLDELRAAVTALRYDATGKLSLAEVLRSLTEVFAQAVEARVRLSVQDGTPEPDPERKTVIVRTAQEALTNVLKHASAACVDLELGHENGAFILTCRDNGRGPSPCATGTASASPPGDASATGFYGTGTGFGLGNLRARAAAFGGTVTLEPAEGGGSVLRLVLPVEGTARLSGAAGDPCNG